MKEKYKSNQKQNATFIDSQGKEYTATILANLYNIKHNSAYYRIKRLNEIKASEGVIAAETYLKTKKSKYKQRKTAIFIDSQGKEYTATFLAKICNIKLNSAFRKIRRLNAIKAAQGVMAAEEYLDGSNERLTPEQIITLSEFRVQCDAEDERIKKLGDPW